VVGADDDDLRGGSGRLAGRSTASGEKWDGPIWVSQSGGGGSTTRLRSHTQSSVGERGELPSPAFTLTRSHKLTNRKTKNTEEFWCY
jgi:hypothetical protein